MTSLVVIIPVKNDAVRLERCLDAITRNQSGTTRPEVLVADNGSTDNSRAVAEASGARVLVLPELRVSELRNAAAREATTDLLAFVDADHEVAPTWVAAAVDTMAGDRVGAAGALYSAPANGTWVQRMYGVLRGRTTGRGEVSWLGSGNLVVRRSAFQQVGGFDASLEACEDVDLCQRLRAAGWSIIGDERLRSVHFGDPPTLGALFRAERWRGRDNLRVSLRGPLTARDIPSIVTPVVALAALVTIVASPVALLVNREALRVAGIAAVIMAGLAGLKAVVMAARAKSPSPVFLAQAFLVALTYEMARGTGLVTRAPHHRQPGSPSTDRTSPR